MQALPEELLCAILGLLPLHARLQSALVCRAWAAAVTDLRSLTLHPSPAMARIGLPRILARFPRLQELSLKLVSRTDGSMHALVDLGATFTGHQSLVSLTSETTSVVAGLTSCPRLRRLVLREDFTMPIPHLLSASINGLEIIFVRLAAQLHELDVDCPLLWAVARFGDLDIHARQAGEPSSSTADDNSDSDEDGGEDDATDVASDASSTSDHSDHDEAARSKPSRARAKAHWPVTIRTLALRSLHSSSLAEFMKGWISRHHLPSLHTLQLDTDEARMTRRHTRWLARACPHLNTLLLSHCHVARTTPLDDFVSPLASSLRSLHLASCDIPVGPIVSAAPNVAKEAVHAVLLVIPALESLEISHCKIRLDDTNVSASTSSNPATLALFLSQLPSVRFARARTACSPPPRLRRLALLGFGRLMPNVTFVAELSCLEFLKLDDLSPSVLHDRLSSDASESEANGAETDPVAEDLTWTAICDRLPSMVHIDLRFTRASPDHRDELPAIPMPTPAAASLPAKRLDKLRHLALYAPPSLHRTLAIIAAHSQLATVKLNYIPDTVDDASAPAIRLPCLKKLAVHCHGPDSQAVVKRLLVSLTGTSPQLTDVQIHATKPLNLDLPDDEDNDSDSSSDTASVASSDSDDADDDANHQGGEQPDEPRPEDADHLRPRRDALQDASTIPSPSIESTTTSTPQTSVERIDATTIAHLVAACPFVSTFKVSGMLVDPLAISWMAHNGCGWWSTTLETVEMMVPSLPSDDMEHVIDQWTSLQSLELGVEDIEDAEPSWPVERISWIRRHSASSSGASGASGASAETSDSSMSTSQDAAPDLPRPLWIPWSPHNLPRIGTPSHTESSMPPSPTASMPSLPADHSHDHDHDHTTSGIAEDIADHTDAYSHHTNTAPAGPAPNSARNQLTALDERRAALCTSYTDHLKETRPWLAACRVWTPNLRQERTRAMLLRRILLNRAGQRRRHHTNDAPEA
ncbi:hypothetical protein BC831DRAFT_445392 [Entophlyctis helioformis]|nr:hypothetical protein BC831DRAFT_445392 [Entophlyctis helioformis]